MDRYTIALAGMNEDQTGAFRTALKISAPDWTLVDGVQAEVLIVNIDGTGDLFARLRARLGQTQRLAVFTDGTDSVECEFVLGKPLYSNKLKSLLDNICNQEVQPDADAPVSADSQSASQEASPDALPEQVATPLAVDTAQKSTDKQDNIRPSTLGARLLTGDMQGPLRVQIGDAELWLDPEHGNYHAVQTLKPLQALLALPFDTLQALDAEAIEQMRGTPAQPLSRLAWFAALCGMPGAPTPARGARYQLLRWPRIEREFPHHFRIAKAMLKGAATLPAIADAAQADEGDVAAFVRAYGVTGHVTIATDSDAEDEPSAMRLLQLSSSWRQSFKQALRSAPARAREAQPAIPRHAAGL